MDAVFMYPREKYERDGIDRNKLFHLIRKHRSNVFPYLDRDYDYYNGNQDILNKERDNNAPNNRIVCNHAKNIVDNAEGYFMGNPIVYDAGENDISKLIEAFDVAEVDDVDQDNALQLGIYGVAYEYIYAKENETQLKIKSLDPRHTFMVCDDSIERNKLFAVYYDLQHDDVNERNKYIAKVFTDTEIRTFILYPDPDDNVDNMLSYEWGEPMEHNMGYIPVVKYKNNKFCIGDFEQQMSLIDAYNILMSDRVNDKEQFIDAVLVLYGAILGDTDAESLEALETLKTKKLLEMPEGAKAEYLSRALDETSVEILRNAIKEDIYTLSQVPNFTDVNFAGNSSGVAMEYKLLGLEMLTRTKERYYRKGLRLRIKIFCHYYGILTGLEDLSNVIIPTFTRALPKNLMELSQIISMLNGQVSQKTLIKQLPFVEDPQAELDLLEQEQEEKMQKAMELQLEQQKLIMNTAPQDNL